VGKVGQQQVVSLAVAVLFASLWWLASIAFRLIAGSN
jgi:hypothetical protein